VVTTMQANEPPASTAIEAIQTGDLETLGRLLEDHPDLATARIARRPGRTLTLLHVAADWPGHFPNGSTTIARLIEAGAAVNGYDDLTPLDTARRSNADQLAEWIVARGGRSAAEISDR
jgi:hypothetical protein